MLVEDDTNPDASPFVIDATGNVGIGTTTPSASLNIVGAVLQQRDSSTAQYTQSAGATFARLWQRRASGTNAAPTIVVSGDNVGDILWSGYDGSGYIGAASITGSIDGTPGTNDMPGRLVFSTTADGASTPTERMRINSAGSVGIGGTPPAGWSVVLGKNITGAASSYGFVQSSAILSDVTNAFIFNSNASTEAAAFTLTGLNHFRASQSTIGAGSSVTNQQGFQAASTLTGATNNYGFYGNIASGTNRFNLYMNGTADNYMAGSLGIGVVPTVNAAITLGKAITGGTSAYGQIVTSTIQSDVTVNGVGFISSLSTQATAFTAANVRHFQASPLTIGAGSAVTTQVGLNIGAFTGATNNYGISSGIAAATNAYNLYITGTANNYMAGSLGVGTTSMTGKFNVSGSSGGISAYLTDSINSSLVVRNAAGGVILGTDGSGAIHLATNGNSTAERRLTIDSTGNVGIGTTGPNASALLDVQSTTKGVRMPNMTTTQKNAISTPAAGLIIFDTTLAKLCVYSGSAWQTITSI